MNYKTSDLALAAYLSLKGYTINRVEDSKYNDKRKKVFIFNWSESIDKEVDKFFKKEALVCPLLYYAELKAIKTRVYQENENKRESYYSNRY